jgi:hypothetical protein
MNKKLMMFYFLSLFVCELYSMDEFSDSDELSHLFNRDRYFNIPVRIIQEHKDIVLRLPISGNRIAGPVIYSCFAEQFPEYYPKYKLQMHGDDVSINHAYLLEDLKGLFSLFAVARKKQKKE